MTMPISEHDIDRLSLLLLAIKGNDTRRETSAESLPVPDVNDFVALLRSGIKSAQFHRRFLRDSYSAEPGDAIRDEDEDQPGRYKIIFRTKDGFETCCRGLPLDARGQRDTSAEARNRRVGVSDAALRPLSASLDSHGTGIC